MKPENIEMHRRQRQEAVKGVLLFALLQLISAGILLWAARISELPSWLSRVLQLIAAADVLAILPTGIILKQRFQEIEGGELDEAGKY